MGDEQVPTQGCFSKAVTLRKKKRSESPETNAATNRKETLGVERNRKGCGGKKKKKIEG